MTDGICSVHVKRAAWRCADARCGGALGSQASWQRTSRPGLGGRAASAAHRSFESFDGRSDPRFAGRGGGDVTVVDEVAAAGVAREAPVECVPAEHVVVARTARQLPKPTSSRSMAKPRRELMFEVCLVDSTKSRSTNAPRLSRTEQHSTAEDTIRPQHSTATSHSRANHTAEQYRLTNCQDSASSIVWHQAHKARTEQRVSRLRTSDCKQGRGGGVRWVSRWWRRSAWLMVKCVLVG